MNFDMGMEWKYTSGIDPATSFLHSLGQLTKYIYGALPNFENKIAPVTALVAFYPKL
jgi:hypothetical protein